MAWVFMVFPYAEVIVSNVKLVNTDGDFSVWSECASHRVATFIFFTFTFSDSDVVEIGSARFVVFTVVDWACGITVDELHDSDGAWVAFWEDWLAFKRWAAADIHSDDWFFAVVFTPGKPLD